MYFDRVGDLTMICAFTANNWAISSQFPQEPVTISYKRSIHMKSVLLIGLGRFDCHMAEKLKELHHEVLAVGRSEDWVNDILP